jgi:hypothetical protein
VANRKKPGVAFWATVVVVGAVLYVLSSGPALWIAVQFDSEAAETCFNWIYTPLWLSEITLILTVGFVALKCHPLQPAGEFGDRSAR